MIKIIAIINGAFNFRSYNAEIDYKPKLKYRIDTVSDINPNVRFRRYPYHADEIDVESILSPDEWEELYAMLNCPAGNGLDGAVFYIEFERNGEIVQLPVEVDTLPPQPNYGRYGNEIVKYSFISKYESYNPIDFENVYGYGESYGSNYGY